MPNKCYIFTNKNYELFFDKDMKRPRFEMGALKKGHMIETKMKNPLKFFAENSKRSQVL